MLTKKRKNQATPLHCAWENGHLSLVQYLIEKCGNFEVKNENQWTPLSEASCWSKVDVVKSLIFQGENKNPKNCIGQEALKKISLRRTN